MCCVQVYEITKILEPTSNGKPIFLRPKRTNNVKATLEMLADEKRCYFRAGTTDRSTVCRLFQTGASLICRAFEGANEAYEQGLMGAVASRNRGLSSWAQMKLMEFRRLKGKVNIRGAMRGEKKLQLAERNEHVA